MGTQSKREKHMHACTHLHAYTHKHSLSKTENVNKVGELYQLQYLSCGMRQQTLSLQISSTVGGNYVEEKFCLHGI